MTLPVLAIHGGAGTIEREHLPEDKRYNFSRISYSLTKFGRQEFLSGLSDALHAGWEVLQNGGVALDAVTAAVCALEDNPLFNAGKGAVFTKSGVIRHEASIMDGQNRKAGAVSQLSHTKNPIKLAKLLLEKKPNGHIFLVGNEAENFGAENGLEQVEQEYFHTPIRWKQHLDGLETHGSTKVSEDFASQTHSEDAPKGTVGAVALDSFGNLAAATSTGGMTNKLQTRIGDTPIIGSGTYAENGVVACSATGEGELFIRSVASYDVAAQIKYGSKTLDEAASFTIKRAQELGSSGGLIAIDASGKVSMPNSAGMFRGWISADGEKCGIFFDEDI
ncbi:hypothetical protein HK100_005323 [Physocladia obscura]|uniref:beta-aspartyl-peptidase n=1 Tax=Physocladia obscura TaxID=109957 RepID=A0AAD5TB82_9FUNG|nr:hypothetical protein HK100_005323 [Physocladia obscura]